MSTTTARIITGLATAVVLLGLGGGAVETAATARPVLLSLSVLGSISVGGAWLLIRRHAGLSVAPALAWVGASPVAVELVGSLAATAGTSHQLPGASAATAIASGIWPLNLAGLIALLLVFPSGVGLGPRLLPRIAAVAFIAGSGCALLGLWGVDTGGGTGAGTSTDTGADARTGIPLLALIGAPLVGVSLLLSVLTVVARYRAGDERERPRIRWLMLAGGLVLVCLIGGWGAQAAGAGLLLAYSPFLVATVVGVPVAVTIAIVRHDLFDIDRLLSSSLTWLITLVVSALIFAAVVTGIGEAVHGATSIAPALAAFVTALILLPLQRLLAGVVARIVDRELFVAVAGIERFVAEVRAGRRQPEEIEHELRLAARDDALVLILVDPAGGWLRCDGSSVPQAGQDQGSESGPGPAALELRAPVPDPGDIAVHVGASRIAAIRLGHDSSRARSRVSRLAEAGYMPIEVTRLRISLRRLLLETEASRERMARAITAERRSIERDLHDGVQQRLIATGMRLRRVEPRIAAETATEIGLAIEELLETVAELRSLSNGVWPSRLDDGLDAALAALAASIPLPVTLRIDALPELEPTRASAAYFLTAEAIANSLKYADPSRVEVEVAYRNGRLHLAVTDDGSGLPEGVRLSSLRDRAESVGGRIEIGPARSTGAGTGTGTGTTVLAVI